MELQNLNFVQDLTPDNNFWHMKARIIRMWEQTFKLDMILIDERGHKIQAIVKKSLLPDFQEYFEDAVVVTRRFGVGVYLPSKAIPMALISSLLLPSMRTLHQQDKDTLIAWCGDLDIFKSSGRENKRVNFDLRDLDVQVVKCTLWGKYVEQVNKFISSNKSVKMVICILQHAKLKYFNREITVQNDMYGTRLFLNEDIDEANDFRRSYDHHPLLIERDGAATQTALSSQTVYPFNNEFVVDTEKKYVYEIRECVKEQHVVVVATIRMLEEEHGRFYMAYRRHGRKALTKEEYLEQSEEIPSHFLEAPMDSLWCLACHDIPTSLVPKFKVQFRVQDHTGTESFVMFDKDVSKVVRMSANDIRERQPASGDTESYPRELDVCDDPDIIVELQAKDAPDKASQDKTNFSSVKLGESSQTLADSKVASQDQTKSSSVKLGESSQTLADSKDASSFTADSLASDLAKASPTTPGEKRVAPLFAVENSVGELSTSKKLKKKLQA
uniref:uncharacterized protein LOC122610541 n=1 Tax=Erigeron canadensis TaxID=72917 RepID=UPI001CB8C829|nr:uncharacterized protein LOC122610541 [Erigeron canadensis]